MFHVILKVTFFSSYYTPVKRKRVSSFIITDNTGGYQFVVSLGVNSLTYRPYLLSDINKDCLRSK